MRQIDDSNAVGTKPTPDAPGTIGFFQQTATTKTKVTADWLNQIQGELIEFLTQRSITPLKTATNQMYLAVVDMLQSDGVGGTLDVINPFMNYMLVKDEKLNGVEGGTFTSGSDQTRDLTVESVNNIAGASLAANQIVLPAGFYRVKAVAPAFAVNVTDTVLAHRAKIYSAGGIDLIGRNAHLDPSSSPSTGSISDATVDDEFEITAAMVSGATNKIELRHRCAVTQTTTGFGKACSFGTEKEYYSQVELWKLS